MIVTFLAALAAQVSPSAATLSGGCRYPERVARFRRETALIQCDTLTITRDGRIATFDFGQRSWGSIFRLTGEMSGSRLVVSGIRLKSGDTVEATGSCEIFYNGGQISVVSCLAKAGSKTYATNFMPSRL